MENFETATHSKDLDFVENQIPEKVCSSKNDNHKDITKNFYRIIKRSYRKFFSTKREKEFTSILYVTLQAPPVSFIQAFRKQYPDKEFKVLIPVDSIEGLEKTNFDFEFFIQNKSNTAKLYKFPKNRDNIQIYGLYSDSFSGCDRKRLQYLAPFVKAMRICVNRFKPDVVHSYGIPFYLGAEFENKTSHSFKVLQIVKDFSILEMNKTEAFWAAINLIDQAGMKKLCRDKVIKKCIASLFNLHNTRRFYQMRECLEFIYENYYKFRKYVDKCEDIDENILFNRMNSRVLKLFPQMSFTDEMYYNSMAYSLKKANKWAVLSKTYLNEVLKNPDVSGKLYKTVEKTKSKALHLDFGCEIKDEKIYQNFSNYDFRELRCRNKKYLLKELSSQRIRTKFVDHSLFKNETYHIHGYLDSFYEAPLLLAKFDPEIFSEGIDIALNVILKLFEKNKNIQVIINIKNGLENNYIKSWVEFFEKNSSFNGRWVFIDGEINLEQFCASADMILLTRRLNVVSDDHFIAMKFGCIPVAARGGIYNDTIIDIFDDITYGCGFKTKRSLFTNEDSNEIFMQPLIKALNLYTQNPSSWNLLIKNCMNYDSSWNFAIIEKYNQVYNSL